MPLSMNITEYIGSKAAGVLNLLQDVRWALTEMNNPSCDGASKGAMSINSEGVAEYCNGTEIVPFGGVELLAAGGTCNQSSAGTSSRVALRLETVLPPGNWHCVVSGGVNLSSNSGAGAEARITGPGCNSEWVPAARSPLTDVSLADSGNHSHGLSGATMNTVNLNHSHSNPRTASQGENRTNKGTGALDVVGASGNTRSGIDSAHRHDSGTYYVELDWSHSHGIGDTGTALGDHRHLFNENQSTNGGGNHNHTVTNRRVRTEGTAMLAASCNSVNDGEDFDIEFRGVNGDVGCLSAQLTAVCRRG